MQDKIAIIGLGYVGLPLAVEFSKHFPVVGFDTNSQKVNSLIKYSDYTMELVSSDLEQVICSDVHSLNQKAKGFLPSKSVDDIKHCTIYIVTVPTPIYKSKTPNLSFLKTASENIGRILKKND